MTIDYLGIAAVIVALSTMIGTLGGILVQLRTLKNGQASIRAEQKDIHEAVNSNMSDAVTEIKRLHGEATDVATKQAATDLARSKRQPWTWTADIIVSCLPTRKLPTWIAKTLSRHRI